LTVWALALTVMVFMTAPKYRNRGGKRRNDSGPFGPVQARINPVLAFRHARTA
jgi:hypothetical protein